MLEMNPEVRKQWCKALRSGEYTQGHGELRSRNDRDEAIAHCCLGVLTDLYAKAGNPEYAGDFSFGSGIWDSPELADPVMRWAGLEDENPSFKANGGHLATAVELNDTVRAPFNEIADLIDDGEGKESK